MGGSIAYTSSPGSYQLRTTIGGGAPTGFPGGGGMPMPDLQALMQYKLQKEAEDRAFLRRLRSRQLAAMDRAGNPPQPLIQERPPVDQMEQARKYEENLAAIKLARAASNPVPQKLVTMGVSTGYMPDTAQLPQALLPKSAGWERGGLGVEEGMELAKVEPPSVTQARAAQASETNARADLIRQRIAEEEEEERERRRMAGTGVSYDPYAALAAQAGRRSY